MPEQMIKKLKKSILPEWKVCFVTALVVGLIAHLYKITNWLPNWDSLVFRYDAQNMLAIGRWFLPVACAPSSFYDLPFIAGLITILFHALGAVCICKMFDVRKNITAGLTGALIAAFPTVTSLMLYNYVADGYALAFLLSCMAAMLITKDKPRYIVSAILIALAAGIYQAYITVTIMLLLLHLIWTLIYTNNDIKTILVKCLKFFLTGLAGMVLYYLTLTLLLKITGTVLLEYQGMDSATSLESLDIATSFYTIKQSFVEYFFDFSNGLHVFGILNVAAFVLTLALYIKAAIKNKVKVSKIILLIVLVVLLPVGASILALINSNIDYHNLMKMGFSVFYLFLILQYEKAAFKNNKAESVKSWTIFAVMVALVFYHVILANVSYHKLTMAYEKSYGTLIRIADRIEQTEGAEACDSILVIGQLPGSEPYSAILSPNMTGTTDGYILRADDEVVGQSVLCSALNDYCGKEYKFLAGKEKQELLKKCDAENIARWPDKNSVFVMDNVIIIKL